VAYGTESNVDRVGLEAEAFQLLALRVGYLSDPAGDIHAVAVYGVIGLDFRYAPARPRPVWEVPWAASCW
jgi:hypothetical protein